MKLRPPDAFSLFRTRVARRLLSALLLAALLPLVAALGVAFALLEFSIGVGLNQAVQEALDDDLPLYGALFDAKKSEYRAGARAVALRLSRSKPVTEADLRTLLQDHPELDRLSVERSQQTAEAEETEEESEREEPVAPRQVQAAAGRIPSLPGRAFDVEVPLEGSRVLRAQFRLPPRFDQGLDRARELAESYAAITRARGAITRGLLMTFLSVVLFVLAGAALLAGLIARSITRKVALLASAAQAAARGDLGVRVNEHWHDELGDLARGFNRMLMEIAQGRDRIVYLEKISGWQDVARRLAHEIKNPLTPMVLAVQELAEKVPEEPASYARLVRTAREIVEEEAATLRRLVQEFSEFARLPDVRPEPAEMVAMVREFVEGAKDIHAVAELTLDSEEGPLWTTADRVLFRRVLHNLVLNAVEAQGARVGVEDEPPPPQRPRVFLRLRGENGQVALDVDDAGPGVPEGERAHIFEPYVTTKRHGTGLGLAIVKKIILQHGGSIAVGLSPEGGASFRVRLPGPSPRTPALGVGPTRG